MLCLFCLYISLLRGFLGCRPAVKAPPHTGHARSRVYTHNNDHNNSSINNTNTNNTTNTTNNILLIIVVTAMLTISINITITTIRISYRYMIN